MPDMSLDEAESLFSEIAGGWGGAGELADLDRAAAVLIEEVARLRHEVEWLRAGAVPDTGQAPESPTDSPPKAGRGGSGEAETATGTGQAPDAPDLAYARSEVDKWLADGDPYCILPTRTEHIPALLARLDELEGTS